MKILLKDPSFRLILILSTFQLTRGDDRCLSRIPVLHHALWYCQGHRQDLMGTREASLFQFEQGVLVFQAWQVAYQSRRTDS